MKLSQLWIGITVTAGTLSFSLVPTFTLPISKAVLNSNSFYSNFKQSLYKMTAIDDSDEYNVVDVDFNEIEEDETVFDEAIDDEIMPDDEEATGHYQ